MNKEYYITIDFCKKNNCILAKNGAVDMLTCKGCATGVIGDSTIYHRVDNGYKQLSIFDLGVDYGTL